MLTHIVCWKYREDVEEPARDHHRQRLGSLVDVIDDIKSLKVGRDVLGLDRSFDTGLVTTFTDREALDRYTVHAAHQEVVAIGREIAEKVVSVDFLDESESL